MSRIKQQKQGVQNRLVFTNQDNNTGYLTYDGSKFTFSKPVTQSDVQLLPNGTAAAPSLSFTNSTGVGLYRYGSNVLGIATAGQLVAQFDAQGDLNLLVGGVDIQSTGLTTGLLISGTAATPLSITGAFTTGISIAADGTTAISVTSGFSGANMISLAGTGSNAGILISGACAKGIEITGSATTAIGILTGTYTTGLSIAGTTSTAIAIGACTTGISFSGTITTHLSSTTTMVLGNPVPTAGAGFDTAGGVIWAPLGKLGASGLFVTKVFVDLGDAAVSSKGTVNDIIGEAAGGNAHIGQTTAALHGTIVAMTIECVETPATGDDDIDFYAATVATGAYDADVTALEETVLYERAAAWAAGDYKVATGLPSANAYLYLASGNGDTAGAYSTGKFIITLYGK